MILTVAQLRELNRLLAEADTDATVELIRAGEKLAGEARKNGTRIATWTLSPNVKPPPRADDAFEADVLAEEAALPADA